MWLCPLFQCALDILQLEWPNAFSTVNYADFECTISITSYDIRLDRDFVTDVAEFDGVVDELEH